MKKNGKPKKRLEPAIECRLKLYDEFDRAIVHFIRDGAEANERTIIQQIKFVLRQAAGGTA